MPGGGFSRNCAEPGLEPAQQDGRFTLGRFSIDEYKPIKVIVIGAGFSGILAGIRFPQKIPNVDLVIYEKSAGYQFSFEDKRDWTSFYPPGHEIQEHLEDVVNKYKLMRYIRLNHEVVRAQYDEPTGKWHVRVRRTDQATGAQEEIKDVGDVLITAFGAITRWNMPDIPGLADFKGELHHTAGYTPSGKTWEDDLERWKDKRVGVIGSGSTAIQVVSALAPHVKELSNYVRGQTWLAPPFAVGLMSELLGRQTAATEDDLSLSPEEIQRFKADEEFFRSIRHTLEDTMNLGSKMSNDFQEMFKKNMKEQLAARPDIAEKPSLDVTPYVAVIPGFPVSCRRLTPGPGYLEALCSDHVDFVSSPIKRFTETGIGTEDGKHKDLDLVFCATGYDTSWQLPFQIVGRNGVELNDKWKPYPTSYLSMCVDGFPNMFMSLGPNSIIGAGLLLPILEFAVMYAVQATAKIQRERLKSMEVKPKAVRDFDKYVETVYSAKCRSWYKLGKEDGRVVGLWPCSSLHAMKALQNPRWEDYEYESADTEENSLFWLGDGQTWAEKSQHGDRAWYLREEFIDRPPVTRPDVSHIRVEVTKRR
ncbi:FAD/NAD(P)-binding domain-containing protein [Dichomitus squalens]|uniref:FAD/NAD(P)-binding domain-containing protein n=1 Tax=Dichomitus squalens TaxID=114155 RepID=A0A4Q9MGQ2_9APHY|nr:FAD/NAD(P)-binding domain-containing protein [Dichomitus squalens]